MMVLRFFAGPIIHRFSPLGLLAISAAIAALGLIFLSKAAGVAILIAATFYGLGKTFFWPTMLGVVAEQFPKGGALTLNLIAGVGMLSVGIVGNVFIGNIQDTTIDRTLAKQNEALHQQVTIQADSVFGAYHAIDKEKLGALPVTDQEEIKKIQDDAKQSALAKMAIFPLIMLVCYLILFFYFNSKGGYKAEVLVGHAAEDKKFTGGVEGPIEG
jgi:fucose permease